MGHGKTTLLTKYAADDGLYSNTLQIQNQSKAKYRTGFIIWSIHQDQVR